MSKNCTPTTGWTPPSPGSSRSDSPGERSARRPAAGRRSIPARVPLGLAALLAALSGCLQIDTHIKLHEDGSATVTEKLRFSKRLLDLEAKQAADLRLSSLLTRKAALDRMKHMGKGIELVSHKIHDVEKGARESLAVFRIADLNDFRYVSPFLAYVDYPKNNVIRAKLYPLYKSENYVGVAGQMAVVFWPLRRPRRENKKNPVERLSPEKLQVYRELGPVFRDVLRDFRVRLRFESYAPIARTGFGLRGQKAGVNYVDIINFSSDDLDRHGVDFLQNEEIMVELLQLKFGGQDVVEHTKVFASNRTVPLFLAWGSRHNPWRGSSGIFLRPSRALFDKHFKGRKLDYSRWGKSPPEKLVPATFERIGYHEKKSGNSKVE